MTCLTTVAIAQMPPAIRALGPIERVSTDSLGSVATAVPLRDGRVLVNDVKARRVILFDTTLAHATIVADTTGATANAYGERPGTLIRFQTDSALFIDPSSLSMLVIGPTGAIARVMAVPRPQDVQRFGLQFGTPGFDSRGRLVNYTSARLEGMFLQCCLGTAQMELKDSSSTSTPGPKQYLVPKPDSGLLVRVDLSTRSVDTAAFIRIANPRQWVNVDARNYERSISVETNPIPIIDVWAVAADGSIAIIRGRDYHVDWVSADGRLSSSPKVPFDWQPVSESRKLALIDSANTAAQAATSRGALQPAASTVAGSARGGRGGRGGGGEGGAMIPSVVRPMDPRNMVDYVPPFTRGAAIADADGNVWIRTSTTVAGQPVYDVVNRAGALVDRIQVPPFRTIAGFGHGVVYMAVADSAGIVHLERARVK
jgi:hypothetical protein